MPVEAPPRPWLPRGFLLLAQAASIHRAAPLFKWRIPAGLVGWLFRVPAAVTFEDAPLWVEVVRRGGTERDYRLFKKSCWGRVAVAIGDEGRRAEQQARDARFVRETIDWLARRGGRLNDDECGMVLRWASHAREEANGRFSWSGPRRPGGPCAGTAQAHSDQRAKPHRQYDW